MSDAIVEDRLSLLSTKSVQPNPDTVTSRLQVDRITLSINLRIPRNRQAAAGIDLDARTS